MIVELVRKGHASRYAVEPQPQPPTLLAGDAERTREMVAQQTGPVLPVGHSSGGAAISEAGGLPNIVGLVFIALCAPDAGEHPRPAADVGADERAQGIMLDASQASLSGR